VDRADAIDSEFLPYGWFTAADLDAWEPSIRFDVAVCFETLEHLSEPARLARVLCQAQRLAVVSVPTVPTKHMNEFHLHDFTVESLLKLFPWYDSVEVIPQPEELSHIFIFRMAPGEV
jgi:2-polyprenyl-3-methyl-5-hydroxy-6-metoxy-1,4-benzoquinol methylase